MQPTNARRYVVAESADALYVAFLGTKMPRDHLVNLRVACAPALPQAATAAAPALGAEGAAEAAGAAAAARAAGAEAGAHSGYLARAAGIPAEQLLQLARVQGKRLVLTGACGGAGRALEQGWLDCCEMRLPHASHTPAPPANAFPTRSLPARRPLPGRRGGPAVRRAPAGAAAARPACRAVLHRLCGAARRQRRPGGRDRGTRVSRGAQLAFAPSEHSLLEPPKPHAPDGSQPTHAPTPQSIVGLAQLEPPHRQLCAGRRLGARPAGRFCGPSRQQPQPQPQRALRRRRPRARLLGPRPAPPPTPPPAPRPRSRARTGGGLACCWP